MSSFIQFNIKKYKISVRKRFAQKIKDSCFCCLNPQTYLYFCILTSFLTRSQWLKLLWALLEIQAHLPNEAGSCKPKVTSDIAKADDFGMITNLIITLHSLLNI